jgi:hypothetical protein
MSWAIMKESTKFKAGVSGNPLGRKKGATAASMLRASIANDLPEIILKLVEQAKNGDTAAAKILLDRCCPPLKPQALAISLPVNGSLAEQGNEIIRATLSGHIPPDIGSQLITALANQSKIIEIDGLTQRIEILERLKK